MGGFESTLQVSSIEYELLAQLNQQAAKAYEEAGDVSSGLSVFVSALRTKNEQLLTAMVLLDQLDGSLSRVEAMVSTLDSHTKMLEDALLSALGRK